MDLEQRPGTKFGRKVPTEFEFRRFGAENAALPSLQKNRLQAGILFPCSSQVVPEQNLVGINLKSILKSRNSSNSAFAALPCLEIFNFRRKNSFKIFYKFLEFIFERIR
jgi:hypothetical protein